MPADQGLRFDDYQGLFPIGRASFLPSPVPLTHSSERGDPVPAKAAGLLPGEAGSTKTIDDSARFSLVLLVSLPTDEGVPYDSRWNGHLKRRSKSGQVPRRVALNESAHRFRGI
jgi:hypothetical protein